MWCYDDKCLSGSCSGSGMLRRSIKQIVTMDRRVPWSKRVKDRKTVSASSPAHWEHSHNFSFYIMSWCSLPNPPLLDNFFSFWRICDFSLCSRLQARWIFIAALNECIDLRQQVWQFLKLMFKKSIIIDIELKWNVIQFLPCARENVDAEMLWEGDDVCQS